MAVFVVCFAGAVPVLLGRRSSDARHVQQQVRVSVLSGRSGCDLADEI